MLIGLYEYRFFSSKEEIKVQTLSNIPTEYHWAKTEPYSKN